MKKMSLKVNRENGTIEYVDSETFEVKRAEKIFKIRAEKFEGKTEVWVFSESWGIMFKP